MKEEFILKKKLENSIMPYLLCVNDLKKSKVFIFYHAYDYSKEALTLFAGYGISHPVFKYLSNENISLADTSIQLSLAAIILGVCLGILKYAYGRENIVQKVIGQKKLMRNLKVLKAKVMQVLTEANKNSLSEIIVIQKELLTAVNNSVQEDVYSFDKCFDDENLNRAKAETTRILSRFQINIQDEIEQQADDEIPDQIVTPK
jgi:hypothetical protein